MYQWIITITHKLIVFCEKSLLKLRNLEYKALQKSYKQHTKYANMLDRESEKERQKATDIYNRLHGYI